MNDYVTLQVSIDSETKEAVERVKFFGALSKYANPELIALEKNALEEGISEDYENE